MTLPFEPASPQQDALMSLLRQGDAEGFVTAWAEAGKPFYLEPGTPGCHRTWLGWVAEAGLTRAVKALLKAGADPNGRDGSPCAEERSSWTPCPPEPYQFPSPLLLALGKGYQGARETRRRLVCCRMLLDAGATESRAKPFSFCWHVVRHKEHDFVDRWLSANGLKGLGTAEDALQTAVGANSFSACWALIRFLSRHLTRDEQDDLESNVLLMAASQGKSAPLRAVVKEGCNEGAWSALGAYVRRKANQYHREAQERTQREQPFGGQRVRPIPAPIDAPSAYTSRFQHEQHQMETDEALRCLKALSERGAKPALSEQRAMFTHLLEAPQPYCRRFRDHAIGLLQPQEDMGTPDLWARWVRLVAEKGEPQDLKALLQLGRGLNEEIWPGTTLGAEMLHRLQWLQWTQERGGEWLTALESSGLDMKKTRYKGAALFHAAAIHGSDTVVAWSLRCGAEVNALDENGFSAMAHAFRRGADPALVNPLSCAGADWDWRDGEGNSLLHVYRPRTWGRMDGALSRELLNDHPHLLEARNRNGHTPLDAECVKLAQGAHSRDAYLKAVLLLRLQAPLTIDDNVLDRAFPQGAMDDEARLLLERAQWERDSAPFRGCTEVDALDEHGWSALAHAFRRGGHPVLVDPLDRAGADWDWRDHEGNTLLHVYQPCTWGRMGEAFSTALLREHPHLLETRNHSGLTPLDAECVNLARSQSSHTPGSCLKASLLLRHQAPLTVDDSVLGQAFPKETLDDEDRILLERARWHRDCAPPMPARRLRF